jgi:hypothetical protein
MNRKLLRILLTLQPTWMNNGRRFGSREICFTSYDSIDSVSALDRRNDFPLHFTVDLKNYILIENLLSKFRK